MKPEDLSSAPRAGGAEEPPDRTPLDWPRHAGHLDRVLAAIDVRKQRQRRHRTQLGIAGGAAMLIAGLLWMTEPADSPQGVSRAMEAGAVVAQPERRTLPDGSIVEINAGSEIAVDYHGPLRRVILRMGEAHFQVAKNPDRAFVVEAGGVEFRAVGTAFAVQLSDTKVEMIVTEGSVAVERMAPAAIPAGTGPVADTAFAPRIVVAAGNQVAVTLAKASAIDPPQVTPLSPAKSDEMLAWRVPRLELSDTPLAEAIVAINRHSPVPLEFADPELGRLGISGVLRADNVEPLLRMLEGTYGIRADRRDPRRILLSRGE